MKPRIDFNVTHHNRNGTNDIGTGTTICYTILMMADSPQDPGR